MTTDAPVMREAMDRELVQALVGLGVVTTLLALAVAVTEPSRIRLLAFALLLASSLLAPAALCSRLQQRALRRTTGADEGAQWLRDLHWFGQYLAGTAGPLLLTGLLLGMVGLASGLMLFAGAGVVAGIGAAGIALPACLLVVGAAALKLPARALGFTMDTRDAIALVSGREFSLLPLAALLLAGFLLTTGGLALALYGHLLAPLPLLAGLALMPVGALACVRRYAALVELEPAA